MPGEWGESFIYVRANAFASRAAFDPPAGKICVGGLVGKYAIARLHSSFSDAIVGFVEPSAGTAASSQLVD